MSKFNPTVKLCYDRGAKTYFLDYRNPDGERRRPRVGKNKEMAQEHQVIFRHKLRQGKDPEREREQ
jgi:hypothetical protein